MDPTQVSDASMLVIRLATGGAFGVAFVIGLSLLFAHLKGE